MAQHRIFWHLFVRLLAIDVVMTSSGTIAWLSPFGIDEPGAATAWCLGIWIIHVLGWIPALAWLMAPLREWATRGNDSSAEGLLAADRALQSAPVSIGVSQGVSWMFYYFGVALLGRYVIHDVLPFGQVEFSGMGFLFVGLLFGPPLTLFPIVSFLIQGEQEQIGAEIGRRGLDQEREQSRMAPRLIGLTLAFVVAISFWYAAAMWNAGGNDARELALRQAEGDALHAVALLATGETDVMNSNGAERGSVEIVTTEALPPELAGPGTEGPGETRSTLEILSETVTAAAAVGDGRWVVVQQPVVFERGGFWLLTVASTFAMLAGVMMAIAGIMHLLTTPLERLRSGLADFIEVGNLSDLGRLPADRKDEVGMLTLEFNRMLDVFEQLAGAAQAVADGDLRVRITGEGDIQSAFRGMVDRLGELVVQIRSAAVEVASAASEIHAATKGQEHAANQQSDGIREVSVAMDRLAESAGDISTDAGEVLTNAEHTRARSDEVVDKITELGRHVARVGELLELIREVANRSDLLALNGSLEATRAGEAGRGFALVSSELRRLAERVTAAVGDVRATLEDVGASNQATVAATEASRVLAENTTNAARRIVELTMTQSAETERVSTGVRDIADVVAASASATTQTRSAADGLRQRAEQLEQLIKHFEVAEAIERDE